MRDRLDLGSDERHAAPSFDVLAFSRRQLIRGAAAFAGAVLLDPASTLAANPAPRPIPGGLNKKFMPVPKNPFIHLFGPGIGFEMATVTDFRDVVAGSETRGTAQGSDGSRYDFDTDMRFMHGSYVGFDGRTRSAAFGFI